MTPEQLAELFVEEQCDNTMNIHTCIEILVKNAYKAGYECAVDKTEEWLDENMFEKCEFDEYGNITQTYACSDSCDFVSQFIEQYLKEIQL